MDLADSRCAAGFLSSGCGLVGKKVPHGGSVFSKFFFSEQTLKLDLQKP